MCALTETEGRMGGKSGKLIATDILPPDRNFPPERPGNHGCGWMVFLAIVVGLVFFAVFFLITK